MDILESTWRPGLERSHMNKLKPSLKLQTSNEDETVSTKPTMSSKTLKIVLLIGSVVVVVLTIMVVAFLPRNDDASPPLAATPLSASQHTLVPHPIAGEPGLVDKLVNTPFYPLAQLVKLHPVPSIIVLVGILLTIIGIAITLGVVLSRPGGQVDVKNVVPEKNELEQVDEESFWQRNMWLLIGGAVVLGAFLIVIILVNIKGSFSLFSASTKSSKIVTDEYVKSNWMKLEPADFEDLDYPLNAEKRKKAVKVILNNAELLNELASIKLPRADDGSGHWTQTTLTLQDLETKSFSCPIKFQVDSDLYVNLYSSKGFENAHLSKNYLIYGYSPMHDAMPAPYVLEIEPVANYKFFYDTIESYKNSILLNPNK